LQPLISIVVPTLNQGQFIEQTLASIAGQAWPRLEIIVIDGGSTDATAAIVERYRHAVTHFVSESDRGQADAINKGLRLAKGDLLAWLNSDDMYLPCALQKAAAAISNEREPRLVYGGCLAFWEGRAQAHAWLAESWDRERLKTRAMLYQPSTLWTRALWEKTGELNTELHYTLDWEWFLRAAEHCDFTPLPELLSLYRFHPAHKSSSGNDRRTQEILALVEQRAGTEWGAAFRDVAAQLDTFPASLDRLRRLRLYRLRTLLHRDLYGRHGAKVKVALSQLRAPAGGK
jgi:glycosyltransferase involved in cell wall biosynthesis